MIFTLQEYKEYKWITDTDNDVSLQYIVDWVNDFIEKYIWRELTLQNYTEIINWKWQIEVILQNYPLVSVSSINYNVWTNNNPQWEEVNNTNYAIDDKSIGRIYFYWWLNKWVQNYKIVYSAWYETIPADIKFAGLKLVSQYVNKMNSEWIKSESNNGDSLVYKEDNIWQDILNILNKYKDYYVC